MRRRHPGTGLICAGLAVTLIGLAVAASEIFAIPRYWTTVLVGVALLVAGVVRRALSDRRDGAVDDRQDDGTAGRR
jgi:hypothetical protein